MNTEINEINLSCQHINYDTISSSSDSQLVSSSSDSEIIEANLTAVIFYNLPILKNDEVEINRKKTILENLISEVSRKWDNNPVLKEIDDQRK